MVPMIPRLALPTLFVLAALLPPAAAALPADGCRPAGEVRVDAVDSGGILVLADGSRAALAGIEVPRRPLALSDAEAWPAAERATAALTALVAASPLGLYRCGAEDRYGRQMVDAVTADGRWLRNELLRQGWARVTPSADSRIGAAQLLAVEAGARDMRRGIWAMPAYALRRPAESWRYVDSLQVVEGVVTKARLARGELVLGFGDTPRRGLTLRLAKPLLARLAAYPPLAAYAGNPLALAGARLRVRGWIGKAMGPVIEVSQLEQIEPAIQNVNRRRWARRAEER